MEDISKPMSFIEKDFMLSSPLAESLYENYAKGLPIVDYHSHIDPKVIADNKPLQDIGQLWVAADPYKHRAMRIHGLSEETISGTATPKEKFMAWADTLPYTIGNPLFHWSAMELRSVFGIEELLKPGNAEKIYAECNKQLCDNNTTATDLLKHWGVEILCTSDDLLDDINVHKKATEVASISIRPSLRADSILGFDSEWMSHLNADSLPLYLASIKERLQLFHSTGCRLADHALDEGFTYDLPTEEHANTLFDLLVQNLTLLPMELTQLRSYILHQLIMMYAELGWVVQLHIGAQRWTSMRLRKLAGKAGGFATIGHTCSVESIANMLNDAECKGKMPKTILYTLNPADHAALAVMTGSFAEDGVTAKVQLGPAWWYNDHLQGMTDQLQCLASYGLLSHFIGMTTDSRSLMSYSRHDYFRRILCSFFAKKMQEGELPMDQEWMGNIIKNICYNNPKHWCFGE